MIGCLSAVIITLFLFPSVYAMDVDSYIHPLHLAVHENSLEKICELFDQGVFIDARDGRGKTALLVAVEDDKEDIFSHLAFCDADLDQADNAYLTPLHAAVMNGNLSIVRKLVEWCALTEVIDDDGLTPLQLAERLLHGECDATRKQSLEKIITILNSASPSLVPTLPRLPQLHKDTLGTLATTLFLGLNYVLFKEVL